MKAAEAFDVASLQRTRRGRVLTMRRLGFASPGFALFESIASWCWPWSRLGSLNPRALASRSWHVTSLPTALGVADADADELYARWTGCCSARSIEQKLNPLHNDGLALYDPDSTYFEPPLSPGSRGPTRRQDGKLRFTAF